MELPGHLEEAVGKTRLCVESGRQFPCNVANIMLFCSKTDLLPRFHVTKAFVTPGTCHLTSKPGMHRLRDGDLSLLLLAVQHLSTPFFAHRFSSPMHSHSVPQTGICKKVLRLQSPLIVFHAPPHFSLQGDKNVVCLSTLSFNHLASLPKSGYYREGPKSPPSPLTAGTIDSVSDSLTDE